MPWLTATALLHAFTLYKARGLFKHWALGLAAATFFFTILATWTTRTGLISSVHAFEKNPLLVAILSTFLGVTAVASAALIAWRWRRFESHEELQSLLSREFLYYLTNLLLIFPQLQGSDFRPWVNEGDAQKAGLGMDEFAAQQATVNAIITRNSVGRP